jgi:glycerophosphoryl diester phosphodiesterase
VVAHRGLSGVCPENTLPAFAAAVALGADEVELDLWASRDGELVVCHDERVDRTSNGQGLIRNMDWAEIHALDAGSWMSPDWAGIPFCRLDDVLALLGGRVVLNLHIKEPGPDGLVIRRTRELAAQHGALAQIYLAGDLDVLACAAELAPEIARCCLGGWENGARMLDGAVEYGCARVQFWNPNLTAADIARAHAHGIICNLFFGHAPDTPDEAVRQCRAGVDAVLTNWANLVLPAVRPLRCTRRRGMLCLHGSVR